MDHPCPAIHFSGHSEAHIVRRQLPNWVSIRKDVRNPRMVKPRQHFVSLEADRRTGYCVTGELSSKWARVNQRQHNRYRLAASVSFSWETEDHRVHHGKGQTRDCSVSGAFVLSPERLTIGSILQMEFSLPRLLAAGPGARLKTRARVVRVEPEGFAVLA